MAEMISSGSPQEIFPNGVAYVVEERQLGISVHAYSVRVRNGIYNPKLSHEWADFSLSHAPMIERPWRGS